VKTAGVRTGVVESASAVFVLPGEAECGDRHVVTPRKSGVLVAVADGLGHGPEAVMAAQRAVSAVARHRDSDSLPALLWQCHAELRGTRGAVMSVAMFEAAPRTLTWLGVGDVEGRLLRREPHGGDGNESLLLRRGVVGGQLPQLQASASHLSVGDLLLFATDGIAADFADHVDPRAPLDEIVDGIVLRHCKRSDDALVLAVRYVG